jgi:antitoxin component HigA of HigAB toxin-antitoxin module
MKNIKPLRANEDYEWALREVEFYFKNTLAAGSEGADRLMFCLRFSHSMKTRILQFRMRDRSKP